MSVAATLLLVMLTAAGYLAHRWVGRTALEEHAASERAARDVVLALQIASEKVSAVQAKVHEVTTHAPDSEP
jgi:hypothetical protein